LIQAALDLFYTALVLSQSSIADVATGGFTHVADVQPDNRRANAAGLRQTRIHDISVCALLASKGFCAHPVGMHAKPAACWWLCPQAPGERSLRSRPPKPPVGVC